MKALSWKEESFPNFPIEEPGPLGRSQSLETSQSGLSFRKTRKVQELDAILKS